MKLLFKNKNYSIREDGRVTIYGDVDMEDIYQKCLTLTNPPFWRKEINNKFKNPTYTFQRDDLKPTILVKSTGNFSYNAL